MNTNENIKALNDDELVSVIGGSQHTVNTGGRGLAKAIVRDQPSRAGFIVTKLTSGTIVEKIDSEPPCPDPYSQFTYVKIKCTNEKGEPCEGWIADSLIE